MRRLAVLAVLLWVPLLHAQTDCREVMQDAQWAIALCAAAPGVAPMTVTLDGVRQIDAALVQVSHRSEHDPGKPQVLVLYASGYVRLKQNADPTPPIPFGTSVVLGPAYWNSETSYHHNPQLASLAIDTQLLPFGPLRMHAEGTNGDFRVAYDLLVPAPNDRRTRLRVDQAWTATASVTTDPVRRAEKQSFKLVQFSSMYITEGTPCRSAVDCHDSNAARFVADDLSTVTLPFRARPLGTLLFLSPRPLGSLWLDALHTDDSGWQGNTPNVRIVLDELPPAPIVPQGFLVATDDPNHDNAGLWLHDDSPAAQQWPAGSRGSIRYWIVAQDNPPDPPADEGLRGGAALLDFEGADSCRVVKCDGAGCDAATASLVHVDGPTGRALRLQYDLGKTPDVWTQLRCDFDSPRDLSAFDHLRFDWEGSATANTLEVGLVDDRNHIISYEHATHRAWWGQLVIPFRQFGLANPAAVTAFFVSAKNLPQNGDAGGAGSVTIDNLSALNVAQRSTRTAPESVPSVPEAARAAAQYLASRQRPDGLLKSWEPDVACLAYTYDQAIALIALTRERMWAAADALVDALADRQNADGSWLNAYDCENGAPPSLDKPVGSNAWMAYAISRYIAGGGTRPRAVAMLCRSTAWLEKQVAADGCLLADSTEATIDVWWGLQTSGASAAKADAVRRCLMQTYWDESLGRFRGGRAGSSSEWKPFLDNQTWGSAFLNAAGESLKARRALSYARDTLRLPSRGGQLSGFDGQGGPWAIWNEGTAQYAAAGGEGAAQMAANLLAQQRSDGAMIGAPDDFLGAGVWTPHWYGVAPTAWLYFMLSGEPFHPVWSPAAAANGGRGRDAAPHLQRQPCALSHTVLIQFQYAGRSQKQARWPGSRRRSIQKLSNGLPSRRMPISTFRSAGTPVIVAISSWATVRLMSLPMRNANLELADGPHVCIVMFGSPGGVCA